MTFSSPIRPDLIFAPDITVEPTPVTVNPTPVNVYPTPVTVNPTAVTVNPTPVTVNPTPVTVNPTPVTVNPTPVTVNPTPVTVNPTPVTVLPAPVLAGGRDFYHWPCVQGEDFPPALSGTTYSRTEGQPILTLAGTATWTAYAPTGPDPAAAVMIMRWRARWNGSTPSGLSFGFRNANANSGPEFEFRSASTCYVRTLAGASPLFDFFNMRTDRSVWFTLEMRVPTVPGYVGPILLNGVPLADGDGTPITIPYVAGTCANDAALRAGGTNTHISQAHATWKVL